MRGGGEMQAQDDSFKSGHSPSSMPVYVQIIVLHVIAIVLAIFFFLFRNYVVGYVTKRPAVGPRRRYTVRKKQKAKLMSTGKK